MHPTADSCCHDDVARSGGCAYMLGLSVKTLLFGGRKLCSSVSHFVQLPFLPRSLRDLFPEELFPQS